MRRSSQVSECHRYRQEIAISAAAGTHAVNVFQVQGAVRVLDQAAEIVSVTTLTNLTAMYADLWDGTNSELLTADGAVLSGAPVGSVFMKDLDNTNAYTVLLADQCRVNEVLTENKIGKPFTVVQKNGADTYIRLRFTTTDDPVAFSIHLMFEWKCINGGCLIPLL